MREGISHIGLDAILLSHAANIRYLSGFTGSAGVLLVTRLDGAFLITDFRYEEQARDQVPADISVWTARDGVWAELGRLLPSLRGVRRIGFEPERLSVRDREELGERCGGILWDRAPKLVEALRSRKQPEEVERIRRAARIAQRGLEAVLERTDEGVTERQLAAELDYALRREGSGPLPFESIVAGGPRSSLPHAEPGDRPLREGDFLLLDFGATVDGYCCDTTRTVVLGRARPWQREMYESVLEAQQAAIAAIVPGVAAREVDRSARRALQSCGLQDRFGHSTGHGIGLEVHEDPRLSGSSSDVLLPGHVVTVEPGVYLPGRGGVRIEDDVAVAEHGAVLVTAGAGGIVEL